MVTPEAIEKQGLLIVKEAKKKYKEELDVAAMLTAATTGTFPGAEPEVPGFSWVTQRLKTAVDTDGGAAAPDAVTSIGKAITVLKSAQKKVARVDDRHASVSRQVAGWTSPAGRDFNEGYVDRLTTDAANHQELLRAAVGAYTSHLDVYRRVREAQLKVAQDTLAELRAYSPAAVTLRAGAKAFTVLLALSLATASSVAGPAGAAFLSLAAAATGMAEEKLGEVTIEGGSVEGILDAMNKALNKIGPQRSAAIREISANSGKVLNQIGTDRAEYITDYPPMTGAGWRDPHEPPP